MAFKRHHKQDLPPARISQANHSSLIALNGSLTTTSNLTVMNIREQFLKVTLPKGASFLNLSVDGKPETPVVADNEADAFLIKLASNQQGFEISFTYADQTKSLGILSWPTVRLPRFSLHSDAETWTLNYPNMQRAYYINSSFDTYENYQSSEAGLNLQKPYTPVNAPRSVTLVFMSYYTLGFFRAVSVLVLPLLYFVWFINRPPSRILFWLTVILAMMAGLSAVLGEFSLIFNVGLTLLLYLIQQFSCWRTAIAGAFSEKKKQNLKDLANAMEEEFHSPDQPSK